MKVASLIVLLFTVTIGYSQVLFNKKYNEGSNNEIRYFKATSTGYIFGGSRILTINKTGKIVSEIERSTVGGTESNSKDGFLISEHTTGGKTRAYIANYNAQGSLSWENYYASGYWGNFVFDITSNRKNGYLHVGRYSSVTSSGAIVAGIDSAGKSQWQIKFNVDPKLQTFCKKVRVSEADPLQLYVIGNANGDSKGLGNQRDFFITKHEVDSGKRLWTYVPSSDSASDVNDILELDSDSFLIIGNSNSNKTISGNRGFVSSLTKNRLNWKKEFNSMWPEKFYSIEKSPSGYFILGNRFSSDSVITFIREINDTGKVISEFNLHSMGEKHIGIGLIRASDSVYAVGGRYENLGSSNGYFITQFNINAPLDTSKLIESGLTEKKYNQIELFPNPTSGRFIIKGVQEGYQIHILNSLGMEIKSIDISGKYKSEVTINGEPGVYFVLISTLNSAEIIASFRVVKQ